MLTGAGGQLGRELARSVPSGFDLAAFTSGECDIGDASVVSAIVAREKPQLIINAAAYTAVDKAESDVAAAERVNAQGPAHLAAAAARAGARLLHVSTDFVFDGNQGHPWRTEDSPHPLSVYGRTKLAGEAPVLQLGAQGLVLRTSWVYSVFGGNFVKTMLRLMASHPVVRVVADQVGAPTSARGLAEALWCAAGKPALHGLHHWRDAGAASWYDFAVAICEEGVAAGLLQRPVDIVPIQTQDYPTPARRPGYSLLDCTQTWREMELVPAHWRSSLRRMLAELKEING